jgi:predicted CxxxxCH...CXXCH cytochrome family protein
VNPTFNAQSGAATTAVSATAFTCGNVSCHGGQTTPGWQSGTLPVDAAASCLNCHANGAAQYNAPTGRHTDPNEHAAATCDFCHDMTVAAMGAQNHYKYLDTTPTWTAGDQLPSDTIHFGSAVTGSPTYVVMTTQGRGGCSLTCHEPHTSTKNRWQ